MNRELADKAIDEILGVQAYPEHDCYLWNRQQYRLTPEYVARTCGTCGRITGFKWRSVWRRILSLFTDELPKPRMEQ